MYTRFFGLTRLPFEASPDPGFLFDGPAHREAIASIEYAVATRMGFIMLTGEVGLGKTTVIRAFLDRFDRNRLLPIYVFHPLLSFDDLLELVSDELGLTLDGGIGSFNRLRAIQRELIRLYEAQKQVILVIDEAQRLPEDTLENLRLLTNLETSDAKLLQIVLVGQPELEAILAQPHLRQLEQRIVLKARLDNLSPEDSIRYLRHRLTLAGADDPEGVFSPGALKAIVDAAEGVPRRMNILANRTLIDAFGADEKPVTPTRVRRVAAANTKEQRPAAASRWSWKIAGLVFLAALVAGGAVLWPVFNQSRVQTAHATPVGPDASDKVASAESEAPKVDAAAAPAASPTPPEPAPAVPPVPVPAAAPAPVAPAPATTMAQARPVVAAAPSPPATSETRPPPATSETRPPPATSDTRSPPASAETPAVAAPAPAADPVPAVAAPAAPKDVAVAAVASELGASIPNDTPYVVVPGDTLWKICLRAYGPDVAPSMISRVMSKNRIVSDVRLLWGKTIILPSPKNG